MAPLGSDCESLFRFVKLLTHLIGSIGSEVSNEITAMLALKIHMLAQLLLTDGAIFPKEQMQEPQDRNLPTVRV